MILTGRFIFVANCAALSLDSAVVSCTTANAQPGDDAFGEKACRLCMTVPVFLQFHNPCSDEAKASRVVASVGFTSVAKGSGPSGGPLHAQ
jgi:hypothetical protein